MVATLKKGTAAPEIIPEREAGDARDHAAKDFNVNPHYIADAKALREMPEVDET
jgi:hypothetical protein